MSRRPFIAGNWKMNLGPAAAGELASVLASGLVGIADASVDVAVAPIAVSIPAAAAALQGSGVHVASQNIHPESSGAFTGELPGGALREAGCTYAIIGHSERRQLFDESDATINKKVHAAFAAGLLPILCVGETLAQRDAGSAEQTVLAQVEAGLAGLEADQVAAVTLAYEPIWAIGTGRTATPEIAQQLHAAIRVWLSGRYPAFVSAQLRIQYGGSVKPGNAAELLAQPDIDGALVGGASLKSESFLAIIRAVA
ncbi:MAG: triosephosphate isomerase [Myxococcota bacterium]|jgi:triosephosphate isomerase